MTERYCKNCHEEMTARRRSDAEFCSDSCRVAGHRAKPCAYCGMPAEARDHLLPRSEITRQQSLNNELSATKLLPCCNECNSLAGGNVFDSFEAKRDWLQSRLKKRYKKILAAPSWSEAELAELGPAMRRMVRASQETKNIVSSRISYRANL